LDALPQWRTALNHPFGPTSLLGSLVVLEEVGELSERTLGGGVGLPQVGAQEAVRAAQGEEGCLQKNQNCDELVHWVVKLMCSPGVWTRLIQKNFGSKISSFDETIRGLALFQNHSRVI